MEVNNLVFILVLLFFSAFFSGSETAFFSLSILKLRKLEEEGNSKAKEILEILSDKETLLATLLLGNTLVNVLSTAIATDLIIKYIPILANYLQIQSQALTSTNIAIAISTVVMTIILLFCGEITPKVYAVYNAYDFACFAVKPLKFLIFIFYPITHTVLRLIKFFYPNSTSLNTKLGSSTTIEEIDSYFTLGEEVGIIEREEKEMISSVFEFGETLVREVMVPRPDIVAVPVNITFDELFKIFKEDAHSRFPVFDGTLDKIVGIIYMKDFLIKYNELKNNFNILELLRPAYFVPETKKLDDLLREFQKRKIHMALVVDEFGGISGLVTIEDLLEEIVGEIVDEYDKDELAPIISIGENTWSVDARYSLKDLEDELEIKLNYEDSETVGGYILEHLGRIPKKDEKVEDENAIFQVTEIKGNRILRVKVTKLAKYSPNISEDINQQTNTNQ